MANIFGGLQGLVDHIVVGNVVGFKGNAAIGVSWQIFLVVVVFVSSIFIGMSILVARFVGANEPDKVNRTVYQAFITAIFIALAVIAPIGYFASPLLLDFVNAEAGVQAEALPYLRIMFLFSSGMMIFFMLSGALRSAGDAKTPMILGIVMTLLNIVFSIILISGLGADSRIRHKRCGNRNLSRFGIDRALFILEIMERRLGCFDSQQKRLRAGLECHPQTFQIRSARRNSGNCDECRRRFSAFVCRFARAKRGGAGGLRDFLHAIIFARIVDIGRFDGRDRRDCRTKSRCETAGTRNRRRSHRRSIRTDRCDFCRINFFLFPRGLLAIFGMTEPAAVEIGVQFLRFLSLSGIFVSVALTYTGGLQGTGDTKSPLYISIISQVIIPLGICFVIRETIGLEPWHIWLAILAGHFTRCVLSILRFQSRQMAEYQS